MTKEGQKGRETPVSVLDVCGIFRTTLSSSTPLSLSCVYTLGEVRESPFFPHIHILPHPGHHTHTLVHKHMESPGWESILYIRDTLSLSLFLFLPSWEGREREREREIYNNIILHYIYPLYYSLITINDAQCEAGLKHSCQAHASLEIYYFPPERDKEDQKRWRHVPSVQSPLEERGLLL